MKFLLAPFFFLVIFLPVALGAEDLVPSAPRAVLMDATTGRVLFQKNPEAGTSPASLTKLMTLHLAWKALEENRVQPFDLVPLKPSVLAQVPPGSSLMFLEAGQRVTVRELMLGLAVDSGNDAGLVLADYLGGSETAFVDAMNTEAAALGLVRTRFFDSFGYSPANRTTALEFARFCRLYLLAHPQAISLLHQVRQLSFPLAENLAPGDKRTVRTITQSNRNTLLDKYPGADGLKTGFIEESGYNLAATATRGSQRLIAVVLGVLAKDAAEGGRLRSEAAAKLLDFGFAQYPLRPLPEPELAEVRVWQTAEKSIKVVLGALAVYPMSIAEAASTQARVDLAPEFVGPFPAGTVLGQVAWSREGKDVYSLPLLAAAATTEAPWWQGLQDGPALFLQGVFGGKPPVSPLARSQ